MSRNPLRDAARLARGAAPALAGLLLASGAPAVEPIRGDADGNGERQITDAIRVLNFLFTGGKAPVCDPAADSNGDRTVNISDPVFLLNHLFLGGPAPPSLTEGEINACKGIDPEAVARGMKEFEQPDSNGNLFSCATCHTMVPDGESEILRSGHTLLNALGRPSFKDGERDFVGAVNVCRNDWMAVGDPDQDFKFVPWTADDARYKDLLAFLTSLQTAESSPALAFEIVPPAKTGPSTGDPVEGCKLFNRSCSVCHQKGGVGRAGLPQGQLSPGPTLVNVVGLCQEKPDDLCLNVFCEPSPDVCLDNPDYVRYRIRLSGPDHPDQVYHVPPGFQLAGTVMPFWAKEKLSDAQVEDLVAFVAAAREEARKGNTTLDCTANPNPDGKVLRRGTLVNHGPHGIAGVVEELDTRKIRINDFSYDGGGIQVRVWLFKSGSIRGGTAIGPDIFGQVMRNTTFVVDIPGTIASDSFDSVSIWCEVAKQDFGSTQLEQVP